MNDIRSTPFWPIIIWVPGRQQVVPIHSRYELEPYLNEQIVPVVFNASKSMVDSINRCNSGNQEGVAMLGVIRFAMDVLLESRAELADLDGGWLQGKAVEHGLLVEQRMDAPCGDDCRCAEAGSFPAHCYRYSDITKAMKLLVKEVPNGG